MVSVIKCFLKIFTSCYVTFYILSFDMWILQLYTAVMNNADYIALLYSVNRVCGTNWNKTRASLNWCGLRTFPIFLPLTWMVAFDFMMLGVAACRTSCLDIPTVYWTFHVLREYLQDKPDVSLIPQTRQ